MPSPEGVVTADTPSVSFLPFPTRWRDCGLWIVCSQSPSAPERNYEVSRVTREASTSFTWVMTLVTGGSRLRKVIYH
eukprot:3130881-Pleurochrysis_carterae.AAC.1